MKVLILACVAYAAWRLADWAEQPERSALTSLLAIFSSAAALLATIAWLLA